MPIQEHWRAAELDPAHPGRQCSEADNNRPVIDKGKAPPGAWMTEEALPCLPGGGGHFGATPSAILDGNARRAPRTTISHKRGPWPIKEEPHPRKASNRGGLLPRHSRREVFGLPTSRLAIAQIGVAMTDKKRGHPLGEEWPRVPPPGEWLINSWRRQAHTRVGA